MKPFLCLSDSRVAEKVPLPIRLLPGYLRQYFLDHINFGNKFDSEMALTHNLLVNIDELANIDHRPAGQAEADAFEGKGEWSPYLRQESGRPPRYASFLATTNDEHPLCDPTGSRRLPLSSSSRRVNILTTVRPSIMTSSMHK